VARGFSQIYVIDTYIPVLNFESIRILLPIAAIHGLEIHEMNVVMAFVAEELVEEIFIEQPEGFEVGTQRGRSPVSSQEKRLPSKADSTCSRINGFGVS